MGTISIIISEEYTDPVGEGKLGVLTSLDNSCSREWAVTAKTTSSVWIEWVFNGDGGGSVVKDVGSTVNGETLTSITAYTMTIDKFQSPNNSLNDSLTQIVVTLRDGDGGTILDSVTLSRNHTGMNC